MAVVSVKFFGRLEGKGHRIYLETFDIKDDADDISRLRNALVYRTSRGNYIINPDKDIVDVYAY